MSKWWHGVRRINTPPCNDRTGQQFPPGVGVGPRYVRQVLPDAGKCFASTPSAKPPRGGLVLPSQWKYFGSTYPPWEVPAKCLPVSGSTCPRYIGPYSGGTSGPPPGPATFLFGSISSSISRPNSHAGDPIAGTKAGQARLLRASMHRIVWSAACQDFS